MDSQLALVLTSSSLDGQNGCRPLEPSEPGGCVDPKEKASPGTPPHNLELFPVAAVTSGHVLPINGEKQAAGGTSNPVPPKICESSRHGQPITVHSDMPVSNNQPIRIKIVVPPRCKKPNINTATFLIKDFSLSQFTTSSLASADSVPKSINTKTDNGKILLVPSLSATMKERETNKVMDLKIGSFHEMGTKEGKKSEGEEDLTEYQRSSANVNVTTTETPLSPSNNIAQAQTIKEGRTVRTWKNPFPLNLQAWDWMVIGSKVVDGGITEEQTEPLDLSLPKNRESHERRPGRFLDDSGYESALIMEVDEFEGEGDQDVVEDDEGDEEGNATFHVNDNETFGDPVLSPSFFSNSVLNSLSPIDGDSETLLLIDDQGIPYTLGSDGLKVPQIDTPKPEHALTAQPVVQPNSVDGNRRGALAATNHSQSSGNTSSTLGKPCAELHASLASAADSQSQGVVPAAAAEPLTGAQMTEKSERSKVPQPCVPAANEAGGVLAQSSGTPASHPPIQILTNPSANTPILLLSPSLPSPFPRFSSTPMGHALPRPVTQNPAGASTPMLLLLSSVPSSTGESVPASTAIAVLDPSTGQLSQITATPDLSLHMSPGRVGVLGSSEPPVLSHPVIRLSPNSPPVVLSGRRNNPSAAPVLTSLSVSSATPALQTANLAPSGGAVHSVATLTQTQVKPSDSKSPETEAISTEETTKGKAKPLTFAATRSSSPLLHGGEASDEIFDPVDQASPQAADLSLPSEPRFAPSVAQSDMLPLEDHLYFSSIGAPPSPSIGPVLSSGDFDSLDALDPLSPCSSPNSLGPRRVLYCQLCPRIFFYLSDLERHAITHSQKKPHICQQCGKAFKRSSHLQRHKHIHTGQRNYVCPICAKRFREAGELQRHQRVHTGEKPYQCQLCHTRFAERNTLRRHTKRKHPYHQVAMEMLNERRGAGGEDGGAGRGGVQEDEESAEWYSSTVSNLDGTDSEAES